MITSILFVIICGILWRLGGWDKAKWSGYRDVLIPIALGIWCAIAFQWWMFFAVGGSTNSIRMGYGAWDPENDPNPSFLAELTKDRTGNIIRTMYGFITSVAIGLAPAIYTGQYLFFALYVIGNTGLEFLLNKTKQKVEIVEIANGIGRASIIFI